MRSTIGYIFDDKKTLTEEQKEQMDNIKRDIFEIKKKEKSTKNRKLAENKYISPGDKAITEDKYNILN
jgi:hypothetical protein